MHPRTLTGLAAIVLSVAVPVAVSQAAPEPVQSQHAAKAKVSLMFGFQGKSAQMTPIAGQAGAYSFTVPMAGQSVTWVANYPIGDSDILDWPTFVGLWSAQGTNSFAANRPIVTIGYTSGGKKKTFIATMSSPVVIPSDTTAGASTFQAKLTAVPEKKLAAQLSALQARQSNGSKVWPRSSVTPHASFRAGKVTVWVVPRAGFIVGSANAPDWTTWCGTNPGNADHCTPGYASVTPPTEAYWGTNAPNYCGAYGTPRGPEVVSYAQGAVGVWWTNTVAEFLAQCWTAGRWNGTAAPT